jgi:hypothetical protein
MFNRPSDRRSWARFRLGAVVPLLAGLTSCSQFEDPDLSLEQSSQTWSQVRLPGTTRAAAFDAGLHALRQWFRVDNASPAEGVIRTASAEYEQRGGTGRLRDTAIGYRNRLRRTATLVVQDSPTGCVARCMVRVERLDTADHRLFTQSERFVDYGNDTPIDRGAGLSAAQDAVWTPMPRDRALERQILDVLQNQIGTASAPSS